MFKRYLISIKNYSTLCQKPFFITTPIFYVNANPHIGHLYSVVIADAIHRFENLIKPNLENSKLSTGTDEHGTKIQQAALKHNIPVDIYCENISKEYKKLFNETNIQYTDFIRTSSEQHKIAVSEFWNILKSKDKIYSAKYSGWYCVPDETFLTESQLKLQDGKKVSIDSEHPVEWTEETNYMFQLSKYQDDIINWIKNSNCVKPLKFEKILLDWLQEPLNDLSVSRPTSRVHWGIRVPNDDSQTIYVWLDALINYLTCSGYPASTEMKNWPPNVHVLGKDILKFHGIYYPAFLIAADIEPPKQLLVHSHWTVDGQKMSKSKSNVVDPFDRIKLYTAEGLRYFLLREGVAHSDGNYSDVKLIRILNSELADTLGNLLSRCCAKSLNPSQVIPALNLERFALLKKLDVTSKLIEAAEELPEKCFNHYKSYNFHLVVHSVIAVLHICNKFVETTKPWELKNGNEIEKLQLKTIISLTFEILRISGIILQPIVPKLCEQLLNKLNVSINERSWNNANEFLWKINIKEEKVLSQDSAVLFKRILLEKVNTNKLSQKTM